jgi:hypothetical protein
MYEQTHLHVLQTPALRGLAKGDNGNIISVQMQKIIELKAEVALLRKELDDLKRGKTESENIQIKIEEPEVVFVEPVESVKRVYVNLLEEQPVKKEPDTLKEKDAPELEEAADELEEEVEDVSEAEEEEEADVSEAEEEVKEPVEEEAVDEEEVEELVSEAEEEDLCVFVCNVMNFLFSLYKRCLPNYIDEPRTLISHFTNFCILRFYSPSSFPASFIPSFMAASSIWRALFSREKRSLKGQTNVF